LIPYARQVTQEGTIRSSAVDPLEVVEIVPRPPRLDAMTGSRIIAALLVVAFHVDYMFGADAAGRTLAVSTLGADSIWPEFIDRVASAGTLGVNYFFVLSGFVLTYNYTWFSGAALELRRFYVARVARIYPLYLLALVTAIAYRLLVGTPCSTAACVEGDRWDVGVASLFLVQSWLPFAGDALNGPAWTLCVEAFFYATFPLAVVLLRKVTSRSALTLTGIAVLVATAWGPTAYFVYVQPGGGTLLARTAQFSPAVRLPEFLLGIVAARWMMTGSPRWAHGPRRNFALVLYALSVLVAGEAWLRAGLIPLYVNDGAFDGLFVLVIIALAGSGGVLGQILSSRPVVILGEASYAVYILHWPLWYWLAWLAPSVEPGSQGFLLLTAVYTIGLLLTSVAAWALIEAPARRTIASRFGGARGSVRARACRSAASG
jgi:peptidoglycan/LPS O-acetylase OafA/YrhL